jgi:hypothetical protein
MKLRLAPFFFFKIEIVFYFLYFPLFLGVRNFCNVANFLLKKIWAHNHNFRGLFGPTLNLSFFGIEIKIATQ